MPLLSIAATPEHAIQRRVEPSFAPPFPKKHARTNCDVVVRGGGVVFDGNAAIGNSILEAPASPAARSGAGLDQRARMVRFYAAAIVEQENSELTSVVGAAVFSAVILRELLSFFGKAASSVVVDLHSNPSSSGLCLCLAFLGGLHQRGAPGRAPGPGFGLRRLLR